MDLVLSLAFTLAALDAGDAHPWHVDVLVDLASYAANRKAWVRKNKLIQDFLVEANAEDTSPAVYGSLDA
jgi:hypothetical protein